MLEIIGSSIDLVIQFITLSMCRRYVFLEKGLEGKKQRYFNLYSLLFLFLCKGNPKIATDIMLYKFTNYYIYFPRHSGLSRKS